MCKRCFNKLLSILKRRPKYFKYIGFNYLNSVKTIYPNFQRNLIWNMNRKVLSKSEGNEPRYFGLITLKF